MNVLERGRYIVYLYSANAEQILHNVTTASSTIKHCVWNDYAFVHTTSLGLSILGTVYGVYAQWRISFAFMISVSFVYKYMIRAGRPYATQLFNQMVLFGKRATMSTYEIDTTNRQIEKFCSSAEYQILAAWFSTWLRMCTQTPGTRHSWKFNCYLLSAI